MTVTGESPAQSWAGVYLGGHSQTHHACYSVGFRAFVGKGVGVPGHPEGLWEQRGFSVGHNAGSSQSQPQDMDPFISTLQPAMLTHLPVLIQGGYETQPPSQGRWGRTWAAWPTLLTEPEAGMVGGSVDTGEVVGWERRRCGTRSRTGQFEWLPKECKVTGLQPRKGAADVQVPL